MLCKGFYNNFSTPRGQLQGVLASDPHQGDLLLAAPSPTSTIKVAKISFSDTFNKKINALQGFRLPCKNLKSIKFFLPSPNNKPWCHPYMLCKKNLYTTHAHTVASQNMGGVVHPKTTLNSRPIQIIINYHSQDQLLKFSRSSLFIEISSTLNFHKSIGTNETLNSQVLEPKASAVSI